MLTKKEMIKQTISIQSSYYAAVETKEPDLQQLMWRKFVDIKQAEKNFLVL